LYQRKVERKKEMNTLESLAIVFPLTTGKAEAMRSWGEEILGPRRSEYQAFCCHLGLTKHRMYLQQTPQGETVIMYLEGNDLQRTFQALRTSQDPFVVWFRQRAKDLLNGLDLTQTSLESLSKLVFAGHSVEEDETSHSALKVLERLGMVSP
jgi:hypothetical protein